MASWTVLPPSLNSPDEWSGGSSYFSAGDGPNLIDQATANGTSPGSPPSNFTWLDALMDGAGAAMGIDTAGIGPAGDAAGSAASAAGSAAANVLSGIPDALKSTGKWILLVLVLMAVIIIAFKV